MKHSLNVNKKDPKYKLLKQILKIIGSKKSLNALSRAGIKNRQKVIDSIKILFIAMFFECHISFVVNELNRSFKLRKFAGFEGEIMPVDKVYECLARYSAEDYAKFVNYFLNRYNRVMRNKNKTLIVDATPSTCDFNYDKQFIPPEHLEELNLKWGHSETKGSFIGFKVTVTLNKDTLMPVSILIHSGTPYDSRLFEEILKKLSTRRIIKKGDVILFDRGYYAYKNYVLGIVKYKIVPVIFPRSNFNINKLKGMMSYPLDIYHENKDTELLKNKFNALCSKLYDLLENWDDLKPERGIIEDFFKVAKDAFGLGKFHSYTVESMSRNIYLCLLLTSLVVQQGYKTKTALQRLAEGDVTQDTPVKKKSNKKKKSEDDSNNETDNTQKTGQQLLGY